MMNQQGIEFIQSHLSNAALEAAVVAIKTIDTHKLTVAENIAFVNAIANIESARTLHVISTLLTAEILGKP